MNVTAKQFNMEAIDSIMRDLRNSRRAVLAIDDNRADLTKRFEELKLENQVALDACNLEDITRITSEMKRVVGRLNEKPETKEAAFASALERLCNFVSTNEDFVAEPVAEAEQPELQEAA